MTGLEADGMVQEAKALAAAGRLGEATSLLQSLILDLGGSPAVREQKSAAYSGLLQILFTDGRTGRLTKVFKQYIAEYAAPAPDFDKLYLSGLLATRTSPLPLRRRDRFLFLLQKLEEVQSLDGWVAECGCFRGLSSFLLCSAIRQSRPTFDGSGYQIYDSFQGLSMPRPEDTDAPAPDLARIGSDMREGTYAARIEDVKRALAAFPRIEYFPGWIPQAFAAHNPRSYRFVHVDVDLYQPTLDSFRYFWSRLLPRGIVVCDDFGWPGAKRAVEEFCAGAGVPFETTPMNQAWFRRPA